ncbi:hypothetical protein [Promicromonospora sp. NPDC090134]|uniref:hypothetical protein n=1 Tax=Promicromonospora sp. NPDC090134 TaxID=3364408 RepID=UPI0038186261
MTVVSVSRETSSTPVVDNRHAQALAALRSAESRTGVREQTTGAGSAPYGRPRIQVRALQGGHTAEPAPSSDSRAGADGLGDAGRVLLPVHPHLAALLPDGGLRAGTTVVVRGSTSLLLTLLAEASRDGAWTVLVGYPAAGLAAAADAGCDLTRTLVVPLPDGSAVDAPAVLAALVDGMDVVVVGPGVALLDHDRRRLTARARERGTVLVPAAPGSTARPGAGDWGGAQVVLEATAGEWAGVDHGVGWLRRRTLRVRRTGRGSASRPLHLDVEVPVCRAAGGMEPAGAQGVPAGAQGVSAGSRPALELVG